MIKQGDTPQIATTSQSGPEGRQEPGTLAGSLTWAERPKHLSHPLLPSKAHQQEAALEEEQLGCKPALRYGMTNTTGSPLCLKASSRINE